MLKLAVDLNGARDPAMADHLAMFNEYQLRGCLRRMQGLCDIILEHDFGTTPATAPADERKGEPTQRPDDTGPLQATSAHSMRSMLAESALEKLANIAEDADRRCYHTFDDFDDGEFPLNREVVILTLDSLRMTKCQMGWLADLARSNLGAEVIRGGAEDWLLSPSYRSLRDAAAAFAEGGAA